MKPKTPPKPKDGWEIAQGVSIPLGAVALPAWCFCRVANDGGDQGGPGGWLAVAVLAAVFGAIAGPLAVALVRFVVRVISWLRKRKPPPGR